MDGRGPWKGRVKKKPDVICMTLSIQQTGIQKQGISARHMTNQKWLPMVDRDRGKMSHVLLNEHTKYANERKQTEYVAEL